MVSRFPEGFEDFHAQNMAFLEAKVNEIRKKATHAEPAAAQRGGQNMTRLFTENARDPLDAAEYKKWLRHQMRAIFAGKKYDSKRFTQGPKMLHAMAGLFGRLYQQEHKNLPLHERIWKKMLYGMNLNG